MVGYQVKGLRQKDNYTFVIEWANGEQKEYRLSEVQKWCPCAGCRDESTHQQIVDGRSIDPLVKAKRIVSVGKYALRIEFTSGCSMGIYSFDLLQQMKGEVR